MADMDLLIDLRTPSKFRTLMRLIFSLLFLGLGIFFLAVGGLASDIFIMFFAVLLLLLGLALLGSSSDKLYIEDGKYLTRIAKLSIIKRS